MHEYFPETSWTLLARAREQCDEGLRAREDFARKYYRPVQEYLRFLVQDAETAEELAQEFFAKLSETGGILGHASREKGGFRCYLRSALRNLVIDHQRRNSKQALQTHPDQTSETGWEFLEGTASHAAESAFHRAWVELTLTDALTRVRILCLKRNQEIHLQLFEARYLHEADAPPSWEELGKRHGMDQKTARERADTVVRHFRIILRRMLRNEVRFPDGAQVTDEAIDREIRTLLAPLDE